MLQSNADSMVFIPSDSLPPEDESRPGESSRLPTSLSAPVRVGAPDRSFDLEGAPEPAGGPPRLRAGGGAGPRLHLLLRRGGAGAELRGGGPQQGAGPARRAVSAGQ